MHAAFRQDRSRNRRRALQELVSVTKANGQSQRFVLEQALEHYLHLVVPSQRMVRPEVMAAYRRSNEKYRGLYKKLAK